MKRNFMTGIAAALALSTSGSFASSAALNNVMVTLTDLNPNDGIVSSLASFNSYTSATVIYQFGPPGPGPGAPMGFLVPVMAYNGMARVTSDSLYAAVGWQNGEGVTADAETGGGVSSNAFSLTPYTSFTLSATSVLFGDFTNSQESTQVCIDTRCNTFINYLGTQTDSVSLTFTNDTADWVGLNLNLSAIAQTPALPEPSGALLIALGVLTLVRAARVKRGYAIPRAI